MIAAYVIGYSVTKDYLAQNTHLKFAAGAGDTRRNRLPTTPRHRRIRNNPVFARQRHINKPDIMDA